MQTAIACLDYAIGLLESADEIVHDKLAKLKALREKLSATFGAAAPAGEGALAFYSALPPADQEEVDDVVADLRETEAWVD